MAIAAIIKAISHKLFFDFFGISFFTICQKLNHFSSPFSSFQVFSAAFIIISIN